MYIYDGTPGDIFSSKLHHVHTPFHHIQVPIFHHMYNNTFFHQLHVHTNTYFYGIMLIGDLFPTRSHARDLWVF